MVMYGKMGFKTISRGNQYGAVLQWGDPQIIPLVGGLEHLFIYSHSVGKNHTDDTIFFRGVGLDHQPATVISYAPNQL